MFTGDTLPSSSYRLGVKAAYLHDLLPFHLTKSLKDALLTFEKQVNSTLLKQVLKEQASVVVLGTDIARSCDICGILIFVVGKSTCLSS